MVNSRMRFFVIKLIAFIMLFMLVFKLFDLQVINGKQYSEVSRERLNLNLVEKAPRGQIYDRYGTPLVTNRAGYSLRMIKSDMNEDEFNNMLYKLILILEEADISPEDSLPISEYPFEFIFESDDDRHKWFSNNKYSKHIKENMSAEEVMNEYIYHIYNIPEGYTLNIARKIIGIRYEADMAGFSALSPVIVAEDIGIDVVSKIKERQSEFPCITVANTYYRQYENGDYASHILGRVGKMNSEEYEIYKEKGYGYNETVGKQGIEKSAEAYLRGTDGTSGISKTVNGNSVNIVENTPAIQGNNIILTIDMKMQKVLEDSLASYITQISQNGGEKTGKDADSGAGVVIDVKSGDVLAIASYPTYNLSSFNEDYNELVLNEAKPLWNRAVSGTYTPGSTFKPLVAIAALETGSVKPNEKIRDEGVYRFYKDYQPKCWIWQENHVTHGSINISDAIEKSCNYFFYETGRRTGIDVIDEYGAKFGLGEYTGIELPEEVKGSVASPEYKKKVVKTATDRGWFGADTLQAAIGQSYHAITPLQLANYAATIANNGVRHKVNLIKNVRSAVDGSVVNEFGTSVAESVHMSDSTIKAVKQGMKNVVDEGSARAIFTGYPVEIGGKTGTAQVGSKVSNNAFFIAFAPFDEPEIAICIVIEHGVRGANAAYVARDVFDYYFKLNENLGE